MLLDLAWLPAESTGRRTFDGHCSSASAIDRKTNQAVSETMHKAKVITLLAESEQSLYRYGNRNSLWRGSVSLNLELHVVRALQRLNSRPPLKKSKISERKGFSVSASLFLYSQREKLVALANLHALPTIYPWREYVTAGGLSSYGPKLTGSELGNFARNLRGRECSSIAGRATHKG